MVALLQSPAAAGKLRAQSARPSAFQVAKLTCDAWGVCQFEREIVDHFNHGFVYSLPGTFLLMKAVALEDGRHAWHITHAIGNLQFMASLMPFPLDWIAFRRRQDRRLRVYRLDRFLEIAQRALEMRGRPSRSMDQSLEIAHRQLARN